MTENNSEGHYHLDRFLKAQDKTYSGVLAELRAGRKTSHWIWFIFPQVAGLGRSATAVYYAIKNIHEAEEYLRHPVLGARLRECTKILLNLNGLSASDIFGHPDDLKFCSSMTLFNYASPESDLFQKAIDKYYGGHRDNKTLAILDAEGT